jgi:hypothetical protein
MFHTLRKDNKKNVKKTIRRHVRIADSCIATSMNNWNCYEVVVEVVLVLVLVMVFR